MVQYTVLLRPMNGPAGISRRRTQGYCQLQQFLQDGNLTQPLSCSIIALKALQMLQIGSREVSQQLHAGGLGGMRLVDESGEN